MLGHLNYDDQMSRCHPIGSQGDALRAIACAAGYGIRWLMGAILRLSLKGLSAPLNLWLWMVLALLWMPNCEPTRQLIAIAVLSARELLVS